MANESAPPTPAAAPPGQLSATIDDLYLLIGRQYVELALLRAALARAQAPAAPVAEAPAAESPPAVESAG